MNTESIRINFCLYLCLLSSFRKMSHHKTQCHVDLSTVTSSPCVFWLRLAPCMDPALLYLNLSRWQWWRHSGHTQTHKHFALPQAWVQSRMCPLPPIGQSMSHECMEDKESVHGHGIKRNKENIHYQLSAYQSPGCFILPLTADRLRRNYFLGHYFFHRWKEIEITWRQRCFLLVMKTQKGQYCWGQPEVKEWFWSKPEEKERVPKI